MHTILIILRNAIFCYFLLSFINRKILNESVVFAHIYSTFLIYFGRVEYFILANVDTVINLTFETLSPSWLLLRYWSKCSLRFNIEYSVALSVHIIPLGCKDAIDCSNASALECLSVDIVKLKTDSRCWKDYALSVSHFYYFLSYFNNR